MRQLSVLILCFSLLVSCGLRQQKANEEVGKTGFKYARNITMEHKDGYVVVKLLNPWKKRKILKTYYLMPRNAESENISDGARVDVPIQRSVVFTSAHANLLEMLHAGKSISGVADLKYMLIPDIQRRAHSKGGIVNCGEEIGIPVIECADYMEESALGRAEWMKFYGLLYGREREADSLFAVVEKNYQALSRRANQSKVTRSVLPDRKVGPVWYLPGGESSVGLLYKDAHGVYAYAKDKHSGSLSMPFETVLDKFGQSDFWILSYRGDFNRAKLLAEFQGYSMLKPCRTGEIYGCKVDSIPYFEEVSWRPDWLLSDLIQLFHPDLHIAPMRYYHKLK